MIYPNDKPLYFV